MAVDHVHLAGVYDEDYVAGWYASEKLDGMRAVWYHGKLYSRYWNEIHAPAEWLSKLPDLSLDGELYLGRRMFQELVSITKRQVPDSRWDKVQFKVFDMYCDPRTYRDVYRDLKIKVPELVVEQRELGLNYSDEIERMLKEITAQGGEGLMLRKPSSTYQTKRTKNLLKVKPVKFGIGKVIGWTEGKGKYNGLIGALIVDWEGKIFKLSGMDDSKRESLKSFKGMVRFKYRDTTNDGKPKEARFVELCS